MLECLVIGDSIAVGISQHRADCALYGKVGINSADWNRKWSGTDLSAGTAIISLGTNDLSVYSLGTHLRAIRARIHAGRVFWVMPNFNHTNLQLAQQTIRDIAAERHDRIIQTQKLSPDHIHPSRDGYRELVMQSR